jgi:hypothetical protein
MSKTWAIVLSIIGGLFLLGLVAVAGVVYWVYQSKDRLVQSVEQIGKDVKDAKEIGAKTDNEGCLKEALARHKRDNSLTGQISTHGFLIACLEASKPSQGFCDGVPNPDDSMKFADWTLKKCSDLGLQNDQSCEAILIPVVAHCHRSEDSPEK